MRSFGTGFSHLSSSGRAVRAPAVLASILALLPLPAADFLTLEPLLQEHCVECHGTKDPEGGLSLESAVDLLKGGESGSPVVPGQSAESLLIKVLEGNWGKTGKNQFMPPGQREKFTPERIALFKAWIDAGAPLPTTTTAVPRELSVPRIEPRGTPRRPINALAFDSGSRLLAVARPDAVELFHIDSRQVVRSLTGFRGAANSVVFSPDGQWVFAGAGDPTGGEVRQWKTADGSPGRTFGGHPDAVYAVALTADGQTLATGGYDYAIKLWNTGEGTERAHLTANQGAIMGLAFRPDGKVLASVGYDRTAKVYETAGGTRLETFGQALKELNAVAISPDGKTLLTGGNDNRIRAYSLGPEAREGSNELVATVFAHEGAILRLAYSPDGRTVASSANDRTVKIFDAAGLRPRLTLEPQPDWPTALAFVGNEILAVGRADGSLAFYQAADGKAVAPPKPELTRPSPRGVERGTTTQVRLEGKNLEQVTTVSLYRQGKLRSVEAPTFGEGGIILTLAPAADEPIGAWEILVGTGSVESGRVKVWVDDLPQLEATAVPAGESKAPTSLKLPVSVWSTLEQPGSSAEFEFTGQAGDDVVLDLSAQRLGAKGDYHLMVVDDTGRTLARGDNYAGHADPLLIVKLPAAGAYRVRVGEATFEGSAEHYFRLSVGRLPFLTGVFPLTLPAHSESEVELLGVNLGESEHSRLIAKEPGDLALPSVATGWRSRRDWKFLATDSPAPLEIEPNDAPEQATPVPVPVSVNGRLMPVQETGPDTDLFRFPARQGVTYLLETLAARRGSPADTRLEVLWPDGRPVEQVRLQAVLNSAITFRPETSDDQGIRFDNWEEMDLNDLLWCGGEVMKLFRAPQGPDSDTLMYSSGGLRRGYFDTTPMAHYLDEPVYLVKPLAPGEKPVPNGLPVFTLNFVNEDGARRDIGTDSRIHFTAPTDGDYLVRVSDSREFGGSGHAYALVIREAQPNFAVTLNGTNPTIAAGSGQSFTVAVRRIDGFEGPVTIDFNHLPPGWNVTSPLVIEAGQEAASGTLTATTDAVTASDAVWDTVTVVATAEVEGRPVAMAVNNLGRPKLAGAPPKLLVRLDPIESGATNHAGIAPISITPGGTARARLSIVRQGYDGVVTFSVDNLPHGVIVENLGLNGITFLAEENEREISLAAAKWVEETDRPFFAVEGQAGRQTSEPLMLRVRREATQARLGAP